MDIIKKIQIKHFRSFLGSPSEYSLIVDDIKDLNLFSGGNDSGKSNFLRALNLFFNNKTNNTDGLNFEKDFFIGKRDKTQKVIEISISFDLSKQSNRDKFLPSKFKISKFFDRNGFRNFLFTFLLNGHEINIDSRSEENTEITNYFMAKALTDKEKENAKRKEWKYRAKFSGFLNAVSFEYIPAIRDTNYFSLLCGRVILQLKRREDASLERLEKEKKQINDYKKTLRNKGTSEEFKNLLRDEDKRTTRIQEIDKELKSKRYINKAISSLEEQINTNSNSLLRSINFLESEFRVGTNLQEFFNGFDIGTGNSKNISFKSRGDGIQAKYIPEMLEFLSTISPQKYYIWGFEEPENSAEYNNQKILAEALNEKFCKKKQIFLTTHSEQFLSLYDENSMNVSLYHVKKLKSSDYGEYSQISYFDEKKHDFLFNERDELSAELGFSYITAKYAREIEGLKSSFIKEKQELEKNIEALKKQRQKTIFVEDSAHENIVKEILNECKKDFMISKLGNSDKVLATSKGLRDIGDNFYFLIDGDCKTYSDVGLWHKNTLQLKKYCIENYLLTNKTVAHLLTLKKKSISSEDFMKEVIEECKGGYSGLTVLKDSIDKHGLDWNAIDNVDASKIFEKIRRKLGYEKAIDVENDCLIYLKANNSLNSTFSEVVKLLGLEDAE